MLANAWQLLSALVSPSCKWTNSATSLPYYFHCLALQPHRPSRWLCRRHCWAGTPPPPRWQPLPPSGCASALCAECSISWWVSAPDATQDGPAPGAFKFDCPAAFLLSHHTQVDGVSSKVGRCVGSRAWAQLAAHVALSLRWSLALGAAAVPLLLAARAPLCSTVLALGEDVQAEAAGYWLLRTLLVPVQMAAMAAAGVLQVGARRGTACLPD